MREAYCMNNVEATELTNRQLLLTPRTAARSLAVSERTLRYLKARGEIPAVHIGRSLRFDVADLRAFIELRKSRVPPSAAVAAC